MSQQQPPGYGPPPQGYGPPPQGYGPPPQGYPPPPPPKKGLSTAMIVLIVVVGMAVLGMGSCVVCVVSAGLAAKHATAFAVPMTNAILNAAAEAGAGAATGAASGGEAIGVKECDDYLAMAAACAKNEDPNTHAATQSAIEGVRATFAMLAKSPFGRAELQVTCKKALSDFRSDTCK
jgi:hypothetical protein